MDKRTFSSIIVKYWYLLEFFGQPDFPVQSREGREACRKAARGEARSKQIKLYRPLAVREEPDTETQDPAAGDLCAAMQEDAALYPAYGIPSAEIQICLGKMERDLLAERLRQAFRLDLELPEKNHRSICLIGLKCDVEGRYVLESFQISPLAWGVHQLLKHSAKLTKANMADFLERGAYKADLQAYETQLKETLDGKIVGKQLTPSLLNALIGQVEKKYLTNLKELEQKIDWNGVMIYRRYQTEEAKAKDTEVFRDSDLANSFFAEDLAMVEEAISDGTLGRNPLERALFDYIAGAYAEENPELHWMDFQNRLDVRNAWKQGKGEELVDFFHSRLDITKAPLGKWPSKFMPCLMQQLAVNMSWRPSEDNQPIFSVNGPPGTGKTTLLKEIIAGNIVERARLLAAYHDPDDAFLLRRFQGGDQRNRGYSQFCWGYYEFADDRVKDYGMLVASCNNAAVENITKELPDGTALLKGLELGKTEEESIRKGLGEVQKLFSLNAAGQENYFVWNAQDDRPEYRSYPDIYFTKLANDLAHRKDGEWDRWGLISAPFGKTSNLKEYIYAVLKTYIKSFGSNDFIQERKAEYPKAVERFWRQYQKVEEMGGELRRGERARTRFLQQEAALSKEEQRVRSRKEEEECHAVSLQVEMEELAAKKRETEQALKDYEEKLSELQGQVAQQEQKKESAEKQIELIRQQIMELEDSRGLRDIILEIFHCSTMRSRTIQEQYQVLAKAEQALRDEAEKAEQWKQEFEQQSQKCEAEREEREHWKYEQDRLWDEQRICQEQLEELQLQIEDCIEKTAEAREFYLGILQEEAGRQGDQAMTVLDEAFFRRYQCEDDQESTAAQAANPWQTAAYNREREKLFYEALQLHKAFLFGSKACLWNFKNLLLFWNEPRDDDKKVVKISISDREEAFSPLLNTVFLLTPVLSTTFASVGRMLKDIRQPGEIGCLIIDEAGQAAPQMALGALFRCRRAIVVGDPKQVEPVVTDELDLIKQIIQDEYTGYYQSKAHSVQAFADRLNQVGTAYTEDGQKTWVGCPLVVHRRCISPMFELSNALSYENMMKQQTALPGPEKEAGFCRESSGWINVSGSESSKTGKDHFVEAQGQKAWELIRKAFQLTGGIPSLFVITPFTTVRDGMRKLIRSQPEYRTDQRFGVWMEQCIGTVHTFQGKEADQVIFLLGCDKNALSAVRWVNANIINVAATRAKYRLYVIGDYNVWQHSELFRKVKRILDSHALRMLQKAADHPEELQDVKRIGRLLKEVPGADSLTNEGELDDSLLTPLFQELNSMWKNQTLTPAQMGAFGITEEEMRSLPPEIRQRLTSSIFVHELFARMREQYGIEEMDASCAGILFCKTMESLLKKMLLGKLKELFPDEKVKRGRLGDIKEERAEIGVFTHLLLQKNLQVQLASRKAILFGKVCDEPWWKTYAEALDQFRGLRNICCHAGILNWQQEEEIKQILLDRRELVNTLVGNAL